MTAQPPGQNAGITLNGSGQMLVGSGVDFFTAVSVFKTSSGMTVPGIIVEATTAPMITNGAGNGVDITADDVLVSGITIDSTTGSGVYALNVDNVIIEDVTSRNNASMGVWLDVNATVVNQVTFTNNTTANNAIYGLFARAISGGEISTVDVTGKYNNQCDKHGYTCRSQWCG